MFKAIYNSTIGPKIPLKTIIHKLTDYKI